MNIEEIINNNYQGLHDSWISELNIKTVDNWNIEATFESYDYKVKMIFENVSKVKYGLDGDYIVYDISLSLNNGIYTFASCKDYNKHEEIDYLYVECKNIIIQEIS